MSIASKLEWRLILIIFVQISSIYILQHYFIKDLDGAKDHLAISLSSNGMPLEQVNAITNSIIVIKGSVSWLVHGIALMIVLTNSVIFSVLSKNNSTRDATGRGERNSGKLA